jgi:hypothetical protein
MFGDDIGGKPVSPEFDATALKQSYMLGRQNHSASVASQDRRYRIPRQETTPQTPDIFVDSHALLPGLAVFSFDLVNLSPLYLVPGGAN